MRRSVFMGTPDSAVPVLDALREVTQVALVVTRPDRPRGRSGSVVPPPVKEAASEWGLEVSQPTGHDSLREAVAAVAPDVAVVAAYGRLIRPALLEVPNHGFVNVHFSLLPRWRGASPVARAILAGDETTGVTLMKMDEGLDTGPIIDTIPMAIAPDDTRGSLTTRLAALGAELIRTTLSSYLDAAIQPVPQDDSAATAAAKIETEEAFIDPRAHSADAVERAIRAFNPKPGAWGRVDGSRIKLWRAEPATGDTPEPGVAEMMSGEVVLGTRTGPVRLLDVQPAGRSVMEATAWMNGRRGEPARFTR